MRNEFVRVENGRTRILLTEGRRIQQSVKDYGSQRDVSLMVTVYNRQSLVTKTTFNETFFFLALMCRLAWNK